jgi:hypothetical protein
MLSSSKQLLATATMSILLAVKSHVSDRSVQALQVLGGSAKSLLIKETLQRCGPDVYLKASDDVARATPPIKWKERI